MTRLPKRDIHCVSYEIAQNTDSQIVLKSIVAPYSPAHQPTRPTTSGYFSATPIAPHSAYNIHLLLSYLGRDKHLQAGNIGVSRPVCPEERIYAHTHTTRVLPWLSVVCGVFLSVHQTHYPTGPTR